MTNPANNYDNFFNMDQKFDAHMMGNFKPTIHEVITGLIELTSKNPFFYKDENSRMVVCGGLLYATEELARAKERGERPENVAIGDAAYMMLLGDFMSLTYDEFAGHLERQHFPHNRKKYEQDLGEEFGSDS
jgi:hypothetical protein